MAEQKSISDGDSKSVILVYSSKIELFDEWLRSKNFKNLSHKGYFESVCWIFVNIKNKTFFPGMPGIKITDVLNNHAVTINEFFQIFNAYEKDPATFYQSEPVKNIYKKYERKEVFVFKEKRFDCDE